MRTCAHRERPPAVVPRLIGKDFCKPRGRSVADDAGGAFDPRNLPCDRAGGARCAGNYDHIAFLRLANVQHAEIGGHPCATQGAQCQGWLDPFWNLAEAPHDAGFAVGDRKFLPAKHAVNKLTNRELWVV